MKDNTGKKKKYGRGYGTKSTNRRMTKKEKIDAEERNLIKNLKKQTDTLKMLYSEYPELSKKEIINYQITSIDTAKHTAHNAILGGKKKRNTRKIYKKSKRYKKAGKAIKSGSYGCVFNPELLCKGSTTRNPNNISKLLKKDDADEEMIEIDKVKNALSTLTGGQKQYFSVFNVNECSPEDISNQDDFLNVNEKCDHIIKENSIDQFNSEIDNYSLINMPNYGIDLSDLIKDITLDNLVLVNNLVSDFIKKAIVPMNNLNVLHRDVKDVNIMYDSNNLVLIDWGFCAIGTNKTKLPDSIIDDYKPLMFNTPFSSLLLKISNPDDPIDFSSWFYNNMNKYKQEPIEKVIFNYLNTKYLPNFSSWDHTQWMIHNLHNVFKKYKFPINIRRDTGSNFFIDMIINYLKPILTSQLYVNNKYRFNTVNFYYNNYSHNCDIWGTCSVFFFIILKLHSSILPNKEKIIYAYQDMLWNFLFKNGALKIDVNGLCDTGGELDKINSILLEGTSLKSVAKNKTSKKTPAYKSSKKTVTKLRRSERISKKNKINNAKDNDNTDHKMEVSPIENYIY